MDAAGLITAICRVAAVLAVAGVVAMHVLTTGHHAELPAAGGASSASGHSSVLAHAVLGDTVTSDAAMIHTAISGTSLGDALLTTSSRGPRSPEDLVGVCMAVLLVAVTTLLLLLARTRRRQWPSGTTSVLARWALHVPNARPPSLFTLGVLRA